MSPPTDLIDAEEPLERQRDRLLQIADVLMRRVEQANERDSAGYAHFERAILLEDKVRDRTRDLEHALTLLNDANARLAQANRETEAARTVLAGAIETIHEGFALFDKDDRLVLCNSRFGLHIPDIREALKPGLAFRDYIVQVSRSAHLERDEGISPAIWAARRLARHDEQDVIFNVRIVGNRWLQVSERRTLGGQTVILQTDVTEILQFERQERGKLLDDQARLIRATLDHLNQGVCIFDNTHQLVGWNHRASELLSIPIGRFRHGSLFEGFLDDFLSGALLRSGISRREILTWVRRRDRRLPLSFEISHKNGRTLDILAEEMPDKGYVISFTDVTGERAIATKLSEANEHLELRVRDRTLELEDALAAAKRANASKTRFVAAVSHDLLQPLSAAKLFLSVLADEVGDPGPGRVVEQAQNALSSVEGIIDALLDISKLDSGHAALDIGPVDLDRLLRQLGEEFRPQAELKGLRLRLRSAPVHVRSDAAYLRRILQNIIGNAVRYTESGGVLVGVRRRGGHLRIEVHDTGIGIPTIEQEAIFGEFHRVNARASAAAGLGLGLAIVERACGLLKHPLDLKSLPGRGTSFRVTVPPATGRAAPEPEPAPPRSPCGDSFAGKIVLLAENDLEVRGAMALLLETWGLHVLEVEGEAEALELLEDIGVVPDAMLVDYQLDSLRTGLDLIASVRRRHGPIPSQIVTAVPSDEIVLRAGAEDVVVTPKPVSPAAIRAFLSARIADGGG